MNKNLIRSLLVGCLIALTLIIGVGWSSVNQAYAQKLINASDVTQNIKSLIKSDEVLHYYVTVYQRTDPSIKEPPDPYHLPVMPFYSSKTVKERWISQDTSVEARTPESNPNAVLLKMVITPENLLRYDGITGRAHKFPRDKSNASPNKGLKSSVDGVRQSQWGTMAWVVKFEPMSASPNSYRTQPQKLVDQSPFASDLTFDKIQIVREIDQNSGFTVSETFNALTPTGPIVLYSETYTFPEIVSTTSLQKSWDQLPVSVTDQNIPVLPSIQTLDVIRSSVNFPFYLPDSKSLQSFNLDRIGAIYEPNKTYNLPSPLAFEVSSAPANGLGIKVIFTSSTPGDPNHLRALATIQSPKSQITPLLKQTLPIWQSSRATSLQILGNQTTVWVLSDGLLRTNTNNNPMFGVAFEISDTFIYFEGQNLSEGELLSLMINLQPANSK